MFDLKEEITKWRNDLVQSETLGKSDIAEMENHLQEEIEHLTTLKLSEEEAFRVAAHRLGDTGSLAGEFAKVNGAIILSRRLFWMIAGVLVYSLGTRIAVAVSEGCILLAGMIGLRGYSVGVLCGVSFRLSSGVILVIVYRGCKKDLWRSRFNRLAGSFKGRLVLLANLVGVLFVIAVTHGLFTMGAARIMHVEEFGRAMRVSSYMLIPFAILLPVILLILLIKFGASKLQQS